MALQSVSQRALALLAFPFVCASFSVAQQPADNVPTFRSTVRRVVVDVVVRDSNNKPVHGLTANDFVLAEDTRPQTILTFDVHDLEMSSIALPPNAPHMPANNFVNIPAAPEHGPLYLILYDMVNMEQDDQLDARRQILKFVRDKPAGTRFALFVRSDDLYLVQGFTEDKDRLYAALDPVKPAPHVPRVFMMQRNHGYGDPVSMMNVLTQVTEFLDGVPGHKNLIWLATTFPLALVPRKEDPRQYEDQIQDEINVLTRAEVAVYPINVGGVPVNPPGALTGSRVHGGNVNETVQPGGTMSGAPSAGAPSPGTNSLNTPDASGMMASILAQGSGDSTITDYTVQRSIAEATGGRAFYSTNDVTAALADAIDVGGNYYTLTYSPPNAKDDGSRHGIQVRVNHPGYHLDYRRFYFTTAYSNADQPATSSAKAPPAAAAANDALQSNMKHGAPMLHDLLFSAHVRADGIPAQATPEQMSQLSAQPAFSQARHKGKDLAPVDLQKYLIDYRVTDSAYKPNGPLSGKQPAFELAVAAYDADSRLLNGVVNNATGGSTTDASASQEAKAGVFRIRQQLDVPVNAAWIRIGVRDKLTNRIGTLEVQLPLAPEAPSPAATSAP